MQRSIRNTLVGLICLVSFVFFGFGSLFAAEDPDGKLSNVLNKHNLSFNSSNAIKAADPSVNPNGTTQICVFCHTPHSAEEGTPLWNRPAPDPSSFELYAAPLAIKSSTDAKYTDDGSVVYPNGSSRLCMSCHDGITAIGALGDNTTIAMLGGVNLVSSVIALTSSHPISFVYTQAIIDADINPVYNATVATYQMPDPGDAIDTPLDGSSRMQCTTCHDPHYDSKLVDSNMPSFWRHSGNNATDAYDDVCNSCHIGGTYNLGGPGQHF